MANEVLRGVSPHVGGALAANRQESSSFLKKRTKKTLDNKSGNQGAKVSWCFFSKKNCFLV
jgi:hypothetical protein